MRDLWLRWLIQTIFGVVMVGSFIAVLVILAAMVEAMTMDYTPHLLIAVLFLVFSAMAFTNLD